MLPVVPSPHVPWRGRGCGRGEKGVPIVIYIRPHSPTHLRVLFVFLRIRPALLCSCFWTVLSVCLFVFDCSCPTQASCSPRSEPLGEAGRLGGRGECECECFCLLYSHRLVLFLSCPFQHTNNPPLEFLMRVIYHECLFIRIEVRCWNFIIVVTVGSAAVFVCAQLGDFGVVSFFGDGNLFAIEKFIRQNLSALFEL